MWIDVAGGRLYAQRHGQGPPLLLLHGWTLDHRMFAPQVGGLADEFELLLIDRRGFGRSSAPPDLRLEVDDLDRVLEHFGLESAHLLGMSQGGRVALRYAATRPGRLRSLLLHGAVVDGLVADESDRDRIPIGEWAALARNGDVETVRRRWRAHPLMQLGPGHEQAQALLDKIIADYTGRDLAVFDPAQYAFEVDVLGALAGFAAPALLLTGAAESAERKAHARAIAGAIADVREQIFPRSGHFANLTEPGAYNQAVRSFCLAAEQGRAPAD